MTPAPPEGGGLGTPSLELGTNLSFAGKRWPEPERWSELVAGWGLRQVQLSFDICDPLWDRTFLRRYAAATRRAVDTAGLQMHSTFTGLAAYSMPMLGASSAQERRAAERWWSRAIAVSAEMGAGWMGGYIGTLSQQEVAAGAARREERLGQVCEAMARLAAEAKRTGLSGLMVENMPLASELVSTRAEARRICEQVSESGAEVGLCLDLGHTCQPGGSEQETDPYQWLRELGELAPVIHLQQADAQDDRHWPFTQEFNASGRIQPDAVLRALRGSGRSHLLCFEILPALLAPAESILEDHAQSVQYWREALGEERARGVD